MPYHSSYEEYLRSQGERTFYDEYLDRREEAALEREEQRRLEREEE